MGGYKDLMEMRFSEDTILIDLETVDFEEPILEMGPGRVALGEVSSSGVYFVCEIGV